MTNNVLPLMKDNDPDCLHCALKAIVAEFVASHPHKSNERMTDELLQFAAQFIVFATTLSPEDAVVKLNAEMRRAALVWLAAADGPKS